MTVTISLVEVWDGWQPRVPDNIVFELASERHCVELEASLIELAEIWEHLQQRNTLTDYHFGTGGSLSLLFADSEVQLILDEKVTFKSDYGLFCDEYDSLLEQLFTKLDDEDSRSRADSIKQQYPAIKKAYSGTM